MHVVSKLIPSGIGELDDSEVQGLQYSILAILFKEDDSASDISFITEINNNLPVSDNLIINGYP